MMKFKDNNITFVTRHTRMSLEISGNIFPKFLADPFTPDRYMSFMLLTILCIPLSAKMRDMAQLAVFLTDISISVSPSEFGFLFINPTYSTDHRINIYF
jgi:hypothetical protein